MKQNVWNTKGHRTHDDSMTWNDFPHFLPFVGGNHGSTWDWALKSRNAKLWCFNCRYTEPILNLLLHKRSMWFDKPWRSHGVIIQDVFLGVAICPSGAINFTNRGSQRAWHISLRKREMDNENTISYGCPDTRGIFYSHGLTLIPAWLVKCKMILLIHS